ncbi:MAG TPA: hypothetical protein VGB22_08660 [candidate division Zixibacteria bacterium]|jgi:hypothetical protein
MPIKQHAKRWSVKEQIINDDATGLSFQFEVASDGKPRLMVYGELPFGNRELLFDEDGAEAGAGTCTTGPCCAMWIKVIED